MSFVLHASPAPFMPVLSSHTVSGGTSSAGTLYQPIDESPVVSCSRSWALKLQRGLKVDGSVLASAKESMAPSPSRKSNSSCNDTSVPGAGSGITVPSGCVTAAEEGRASKTNAARMQHIVLRTSEGMSGTTQIGPLTVHHALADCFANSARPGQNCVKNSQ